MSKQITGYQTQLAAIQKQLTDLNAELAGKDDFYNKKLTDFSQLHSDKLDAAKSHLSTSVKQIQRQLGKTRGDWLIADAEYLMTVANQRLHLTNDVNTTREALIAADQRLRESGDAAVFKIREQLAKEIAAIKKLTTPDIVGIYSKIQILQGNIDKLTLFLPHSGKGITKPDENPTEPQADEEPTEQTVEVQDILGSAFGELGDLVTIRHTDRPIKSILTAEEVYFIQQQLEVKLEMAKLALVQGNEKLYKAAGRQILKLIEKDLKPLDIVTEKSIDNAFALDMAMGGSTNTVLHTLAIASEAGIKYDLEKINAISAKCPNICKVSPSSSWHMEDVDAAGGISAILN